MEFYEDKFRNICIERGHHNYEVEYIPAKHHRCIDCGSMKEAQFKNEELRQLDKETDQ